jgi:hypothetical protein
LLGLDESSCDRGVLAHDLSWLTKQLQTLGLLATGERLMPVPTGGRANQALSIQNHAGNRLGWIHIDGETPVGGVWRTTCTASEHQVGQRCWLRRDHTWGCANE